MSGTIVPPHVDDNAARVGSDAAPSTAAALEESTQATAKPSVSVGQQLRAARQAKNLAVDEVAKALKLSPRQIVALEDDDWSSLPCTTIIRGFVRNYARLLGVDADALMASLDLLTMPQGAELEVTVGTPVSMPAEGRVDRRDFARVLAGLFVLALAVAAYFFFPQELWLSTLSALKSATQSAEVVADKAPAAEAEEGKASETAAVPAEAVPTAVQPAATPAAAAASAPVSAAAATPASSSANLAANPAPSASSSAPANASANVLKFSFAQASWVEVRDRSGQVIFSKKNDAGSEREVEGQPPFALVIGNAGYVTLQYKGKTVDLSKRSKEDVARLTLE